MDDKDILARVGELVTEERALRERAVGHGLQEDERTRLADVEARLDQCWDLLRQRRARSEFGENPDGATLRPAWEVEGYES
ncbi:DUF2630 family protein [Streptomyces litchfieldiae]|uniref:DUF2630 family protein n=1 Tax=Streptomyces litchfieldiae TaxID=3075543 RepID=A0ABU2MW67_9ACTN|nr:DUF2630 family protein [Streptomyces sp. DSM 44938]MDT0345888.1 DUF2630 family protein [Streptomyces sp. DSM 44938]